MNYPYIHLRSLPIDERSVNVTRESTHREQRRRFRTCFSDTPDPTWITMDQLFATLAHGKPGEYILEGA